MIQKNNKQFIDEIVDNALTEIDIKKENTHHEINGRITPALLEISPYFKNRKYENEKEWRLVISKVHDKSKIKEKV